MLVEEIEKCYQDNINRKKLNEPIVHQKSANDIKTYYFIPLTGKRVPLDWVGAKSYIIYDHQTKNKKTGEITTKRLRFISSLKDFETSVEAIENRWSIENDLHRYKDLLLSEDSIRFTNPNLVNNLSILNNVALTLIKLAKPIINIGNMKFIRKVLEVEGEETLFKVIKLIGSPKLIKDITNNIEKKQKKQLKK